MKPLLPGLRPPPADDDPVGLLRHCHGKIRGRLDSLPRIAAALREPGRSDEARTALAEVLGFFETSVARHHEDEEFSLFPRLQDDPATNALLDAIGAEHRTLEAIFLALKTILPRLPSREALADLDDHLPVFVSTYREHLEREEREVFERAVTLPPAELRAIGIEMRLRRGGPVV